MIAHNCTDATAAAACAAGAEAVVLDDASGGKGLALDYGFRHALAAGADAVLVVDADSTVMPGLIASVSQALASGAQALQCSYQVANAQTTPRTRLAALAFFGMNGVRPLGRERLGLSCGIFGNGFALTAQTLARVPYIANSLVEDLEYHLHLIDAGIRVQFVPGAEVVAEMPEASAAQQSQRARWEGGRILMRRQWAGPLVRRVLRGQLRLLEPLLDLLALPLASEAGLLALALAVGLAAHLSWLWIYALLGFAGVLLYVFASALLSPEPGQTLRALTFAPVYMAWKLIMIPRTRAAARRDAVWVRTGRNAEPPPRDIP